MLSLLLFADKPCCCSCLLLAPVCDFVNCSTRKVCMASGCRLDLSRSQGDIWVSLSPEVIACARGMFGAFCSFQLPEGPHLDCRYAGREHRCTAETCGRQISNIWRRTKLTSLVETKHASRTRSKPRCEKRSSATPSGHTGMADSKAGLKRVLLLVRRGWSSV